MSADDQLRITHDVTIPLRDIEIRASRSSGPGGQHANVTASRIEASFDVAAASTLTDGQKARVAARAGPRVVAVAQDARSQARNRELALERLRARLAVALAVPRPRTPTGPSRAVRARRMAAQRLRGERKRARRERARRMAAKRLRGERKRDRRRPDAEGD
jgi:ribosome-associated protein